MTSVVVSRFESHLLRILRFLVGATPYERVANLIATRTAAPPCLSAACLDGIEDTLAKAIPLWLVRVGGWRSDLYLRNGLPTMGRIWERVPVEERRLTFGPSVISFLIWLTSEKPSEPKTSWDPAGPFSTGDTLFFARSLEALATDPPSATHLAGRRPFRENAFAALLNPALIGSFMIPFKGAFLSPLMAPFLECLQPALAARWTASERAKGRVTDWQTMRRRGEREAALLSNYLSVCENIQRPDLARFVLATNQALFERGGRWPEEWTGSLSANEPARLAERLEIQRLALAMPAQMATLEWWNRRAESVGYLDDDYEASRLWKADWERYEGARSVAAARALFEQLQPLGVRS